MAFFVCILLPPPHGFKSWVQFIILKICFKSRCLKGGSYRWYAVVILRNIDAMVTSGGQNSCLHHALSRTRRMIRVPPYMTNQGCTKIYVDLLTLSRQDSNLLFGARLDVVPRQPTGPFYFRLLDNLYSTERSERNAGSIPPLQPNVNLHSRQSRYPHDKSRGRGHFGNLGVMVSPWGITCREKSLARCVPIICGVNYFPTVTVIGDIGHICLLFSFLDPQQFDR